MHIVVLFPKGHLFLKDMSTDYILWIRTRHMATKNPNSPTKTNLMGKVKKSLINGTNNSQVKRFSLRLVTFQNLRVINTQKFGGVTDGSMCFIDVTSFFFLKSTFKKREQKQGNDSTFLGSATR